MSLNVLNHLGIHLYSNLPAVLSEAVANAWDADATRVEIDIDTRDATMTISDNGIGMTVDEINGRYLKVGYQRRQDEDDPHGAVTRMERPVMGRKGIGKLSLFSIAKTIEVRSTAIRPEPLKDDAANVKTHAGLVMDVDEIEKQIGDEGGTYHPDPLPRDDIRNDRGTTIRLLRPKKDLANTSLHLRRRLARRFSTRAADFEIVLDGHTITVADRDIYDKCRYVWIFGNRDEIAHTRNLFVDTASRIVELSGTTRSGRTVSGWIGSSSTSTDLKAQTRDDESLNRIAVLVRNKLAQEDVLDLADQGGLFTKFLTGELHADWLDDSDRTDIATSSRQGIVEDDERFLDLQEFLERTVRKIGGDWNKFREEDGLKDAAKDVPAIQDWINSLVGDEKRAARSFMGKVNAAAVSQDHRRQLLVSGVIAFERLRRRERLSAIEATDEANIPALLSAFESIDDVESAMYYDLVKGRLQVIEKFVQLVDADHKEAVLQKYIFEHLWLLDPGWDQATVPVMEQTVATLIGKKGAPDDRFDIKYRTSGTNHVIVELKRSNRVVSTFELLEQLQKYRDPIKQYLKGVHGVDVDLQVICLVGRDLKDWKNENGREDSRATLAQYGARVVKYDKLMRDARQSYQDFLNEHEKLGSVREVVAQIEAALTAPEAGSDAADTGSAGDLPVVN